MTIPQCDIESQSPYAWDTDQRRCDGPVAFSYRPVDAAGWADGYVNYRCAKHIHWLDPTIAFLIKAVGPAGCAGHD